MIVYERAPAMSFTRYNEKQCVPLIVIGAVTLVYSAVVMMVSSMNAGVAAVIGLGIMFIILGSFNDIIRERVPIWIKVIFFVCVAIGVSMMLFLIIYGNVDNVTYDEDALIVLGAGLRGETPTDTLKMRLDTAVEYHKRNPDAIIVVTGGQGKDEMIEESTAMERYLIMKGVPGDVIVKEMKSTSTYENFLFAKEILDELFDGPYKAAYATSDYHIFRAGTLAKDIGFESLTHCHGMSTWYLFAPNVLRECMAVVKQCIIDKI